MNSMKRNGKIELLRFLCSIAVVLFHCQSHYMDIDKSTVHFAFFVRGELCVEFFFLLTGFLMAKTIYKRTHDSQGRILVPEAGSYDLGLETLQYTWNKVKALLPWHFVSFALLFVGRMIHEQFSLREALAFFGKVLPNFFLIQRLGYTGANLNRVE